MSDVIRHVVDSITPASAAHAEGARQRIAGAGTPILERLAMRLAAAQHRPGPRVDKRTALIVAGDHGVGDPGLAMGDDHPTIVALRAIDAGTATLSQLARSARLPLVLVDAGIREPDRAPASTIRLGHRPTHDLTREPAMTVVDASLALEAGIALVVALEAPDLLVLGAIGVGAEVSAAAILGGPLEIDDDVARAAALRERPRSPLELLAEFGGPETAVLAGAILAAASLNIPIVLDNYATGAAALVARAFAPHVPGYLIAAHGGSYVHPKMLATLGLSPIFEVGLGHGEGTGAAMIVPMCDQVAALCARE